MKRLLLMSVLTLGLTACPQTTTPTLAVPSGAATLDGRWTGEVRQYLSGGPRTARSPQTVYNLLDEGGYDSRRTFSILAQRLDSGAVLSRMKLSGMPNALGYRAPANGAPARLLVQSRSGTQVQVEERDPDTLEVRSTWSFSLTSDSPDSNMYSENFTLDGLIFASPDGQRIDTVTHQPLPVHPEIQAQLSRTAGQNGHLSWSPDAQWLEVTTYVPGAFGSGNFRYDFIRNTDGRTFSGAPLHPVGCGLRGSDSWSRTILGLPDGGMALTFQDGVVELRRADGSLRQAVSLGGCGRYGFWFGGDVLSLEGPERTARIRVADGVILPGDLLTPALPSLNVTLDMQATYISENNYESSGTATVDGVNYTLNAKATALGITLKPQTSPVRRYVDWTGELRRTDGTVYATLRGGHGATEASQSVSLQLNEPVVGFSYSGSLKR